ncbi:MAG: hypothetical protein Q4E13_03375 [Clostridia bacterium]|nr:hypothetical protein [Clostridia bacterium]
MRKLCACALALTLLNGSALAEITIDPATATLEELIEARDRIDAEIDARRIAEAASFASGSYVVGEDMPAGSYVIYPDESSRVSSIAVRALVKDEEQLVAFESVRVQAVVEVSDGQTLELTNATAMPLEFSDAVDLSAEDVCNGGYLVGVHLPAGTYRLAPVKDALLPSYSVQNAPTGRTASILAFAVIHESVEITLEEGNYIQLTNCVLTAAS